MKVNLLKALLIVFVLSNHCIAKELQTHLEKSNFTGLTSHEQLMRYVRELEKSSPLIDLKIIGSSVQGREIPALFFTVDKKFASHRNDKPVVLIVCQQHGDEPSAKEAALIVARKLIGNERALLNHLDIILVPQLNPDGSELGQRNNANGVDLNRNHVILSEPESFAIHNLFLDWMPEVTLDLHEYNAIKKDWIQLGYVKDADEMLGGVTNLNIDSTIIHFTRNTVIPETGARIQASGWRFHRYIIGGPCKEARIRYSTTSINDARQSMGIHNTLSFIIEGKRYGDLMTEIKRRTEGQVSALVSFLKTVDAHAKTISILISDARQKSIQSDTGVEDRVILQMDYYPDPAKTKLAFPVFDLLTWTHTMRDFPCFEPLVKAKKSIIKPYGYFFSSEEKSLMNVLRKHRIPLYRLKENSEIEVELYKILHVTPGTEEDKSTQNVDVSIDRKKLTISPDEIIIRSDSVTGELIPLILEPQSTWSIVTKRSADAYYFKHYLDEQRMYPIGRIPGGIDAPMDEITDFE